MRRFLYFIKGFEGQPGRAKCAAAGQLEYAFPKGMPFVAKHVDAGALGKGLLCGVGEARGLEYSADSHEWHEMTPARPGVFIGVPKAKADRPGPDELLVAEQMLSEGRRVTLEDGHEWHIPVCRFMFGNTELPRVLVHEDGKVTWKTKAEYRKLFDMSEQIVRRLLLEADSNYSAEEIAEWVGLALGVNYRVGADEVCHLGLISSDKLQDISNVIIDAEKLAELLKSFQKVVEGP